MTKKYKTWTVILTVMSVLLNIGPLAVYTIIALISSDLTTEKVALTTTVFIVVILTVVAIVNKCAMKSRLWIILIGIYVCLHNILTPIIIIGICQVVDELFVSPINKIVKTKYTIHKELDKRL